MLQRWSWFLGSCGAVLLVATSAGALGLGFVLTDTATGAKARGRVMGLADDATSAAASVELRDAGGLAIPVPIELVGFASANSWTVAAGQVVSVDFFAQGFLGFPDGELDLFGAPESDDGILQDEVDFLFGPFKFVALPEPRLAAVAFVIGALGALRARRR